MHTEYVLEIGDTKCFVQVCFVLRGRIMALCPVRPSLRDSQGMCRMRSSSSDFGSIAITVRPLSAQPRFLRRKVAPEIPAIFKDKQLAAVLRLTRKVTPDTPLASEQKRLVAAVAAKKAARCESKRHGRGEQPPDAHLLRPEPFYSQTVTPLMRAIMELTLITVRPPDPKPPQSERIGPPWGSPCGGRLPSSPQMSKPPLSSASKLPSSPPSQRTTFAAIAVLQIVLTTIVALQIAIVQMVICAFVALGKADLESNRLFVCSGWLNAAHCLDNSPCAAVPRDHSGR